MSSVPKRNPQKVHCGTNVHWILKHVEREACHSCIHQDAEVVAEIGSGDSQRPHR